MDPNIRIGDAERDEAIKRLRAHHAAGRIDMIEFDDRMEKALEARTTGDLLAIFTDLPDQPFDQAPGPYGGQPQGPYAQSPHPVDPYATHPVPAGMPPHQRPLESVETKVDKPFYASGGIFWVLFMLMIFTGGRLWPLVVLGGIWIWVVAPMMQGYRNPQQVEPQKYYYPTGDIRAEISALLHANRKIEAVKRYREVYGLGLREAKEAVDAIEREDRQLGY